MSTTRRSLLRRSGALAASLLAAPLVRAQAAHFPDKPITLVVPFAPGGNIDIVGRSVAVPLGKILGQSVIVDNRAGGSGSIGTGVVARAATDGYTLLVATAGQIVTLPQMFKTPYRGDSIKPLGLVSKTNIATIVRKGDKRFKTFQELVAYAKANPGKLNGGHAGAGTPNHLALLQLESTLGIEFTMVAYKGMGPALIDLLGGQIDVVGDQVSSSMPHLKAGTLEALAVLGPERDPAFPAVPTLVELKLGNFDMTTYAGILAPAGVSADVTARLSDAVRQAAADPAFGATLRELGSGARGGTAAQFAALIKDEETFAARMIQQGRLKAD